MDWTLLGQTVAFLWLFGLSCAMIWLIARVTRLGQEAETLQAQLSEQIRGLRADLGQVASAQQVAEIRTMIAAGVADGIARQPRPRAAKVAPGMAFSGPTTITGGVAGAGIGEIAQHAPPVPPG